MHHTDIFERLIYVCDKRAPSTMGQNADVEWEQKTLQIDAILEDLSGRPHPRIDFEKLISRLTGNHQGFRLVEYIIPRIHQIYTNFRLDFKINPNLMLRQDNPEIYDYIANYQ